MDTETSHLRSYPQNSFLTFTQRVHFGILKKGKLHSDNRPDDKVLRLTPAGPPLWKAECPLQSLALSDILRRGMPWPFCEHKGIFGSLRGRFPASGAGRLSWLPTAHISPGKLALGDVFKRSSISARTLVASEIKASSLSRRSANALCSGDSESSPCIRSRSHLRNRASRTSSTSSSPASAASFAHSCAGSTDAFAADARQYVISSFAAWSSD
ncbi:hypothetical protein SAMN05216345_10350 [Cupriavidus sp. YR651]|nr:hypothetical protein SAMN05216345_10350 [Cupriavidus sp. YR651]